MGTGRRGLLCCFSRSPPAPPAHHPAADAYTGAPAYNGRKQHNQATGLDVQQQHQIQRHVDQIDARLDSLKGDLAKEMAYPLAVRLIHEVSAVFDPNLAKMSSCSKHPNPWGWLHRNHDFKRALSDQGGSISDDMKSVDAISYRAAQIVAHSNRKFMKSYPEVLYKDLQSFKDKGYMEALSTTDADLHSFLELSNFFATAFIAKPRLLQIATFMLQRVRDELAIYWHTWEKLPFSWDERWHEAESWFQAAVDCFREHGDGNVLPDTIIGLAREFDSVEEATRRIYGVNRVKEVGSFEQILKQFEEMKESGLLTPEVQRQNLLCFAFLEYSPEIKNRYMAIIEKKHVMEEERKSLPRNSLSRLTSPEYHIDGLYGSPKSSPRVKIEHQGSH